MTGTIGSSLVNTVTLRDNGKEMSIVIKETDPLVTGLSIIASIDAMCMLNEFKPIALSQTFEKHGITLNLGEHITIVNNATGDVFSVDQASVCFNILNPFGAYAVDYGDVIKVDEGPDTGFEYYVANNVEIDGEYYTHIIRSDGTVFSFYESMETYKLVLGERWDLDGTYTSTPDDGEYHRALTEWINR